MSIDKDRLTAALLPDPEEGWRVHRPEGEAPLLCLCTRQSRWERALFNGKLPLRGRTRYELQCVFHVDLLDFNTLAQCLDLAAGQLARRLEHHTGPVRSRLSAVILCDRALPDALERLESVRPAVGVRHAAAYAAAVELSEGILTLSPGARALAHAVKAALSEA